MHRSRPRDPKFPQCSSNGGSRTIGNSLGFGTAIACIFTFLYFSAPVQTDPKRVNGHNDMSELASRSPVEGESARRGQQTLRHSKRVGPGPKGDQVYSPYIESSTTKGDVREQLYHEPTKGAVSRPRQSSQHGNGTGRSSSGNQIMSRAPDSQAKDESVSKISIAIDTKRPAETLGTAWSMRGGDKAFALNASALLHPRSIRRSAHSCANKEWGYDYLYSWARGGGKVHCRPARGGSGATVRKHCARFPLQGGNRCYHSIEFYDQVALAVTKGGGDPSRPRWSLPCDVAPGGSLESAGNAMQKVFQRDSPARAQQLLKDGTLTKPHFEGFIKEISSGSASRVDWIRPGPAPGDGVGSSALSYADFEAMNGSKEGTQTLPVEYGGGLSWPTRSKAEHGFVYYIVNRDCGPPRWNPFHCTADIWNGVMMLSALYLAPIDVVVLFTDSRTYSPYEHMWRTIGGAGVYTAARLAGIPPHLRPPMRRAIVSPSGDSSFMWQQGHGFSKCHHKVGSYLLMQEHILQGLSLWPGATDADPQAATEVVFVSRKPKPGVKMTRRVGNEDAVVEGLKRVVQKVLGSPDGQHLPSSLQVYQRDFAELQIRDQIAICLRARLIVGPHGAGLTWAMFYQSLPGAGLVEISPYINGNKLWPKLFANAAVMIGVNYVRWHAKSSESVDGGLTTVHVPSIEGLAETILKLDPTEDLGPRQGGPGVLGLIQTGGPTQYGKMPGMQSRYGRSGRGFRNFINHGLRLWRASSVDPNLYAM